MGISLEFKEGAKAANRGLKLIDNPYKPVTAFGNIGVQKYADWMDGYLKQKGYDFTQEPYEKVEIEQYHGSVGIFKL